MLDHTAGLAKAVGAEVIVFHPGFLLERERERAIADVDDQLGDLRSRLEEAERVALEARETVGADDRVSVSTTRLALGVVRAGQGRYEEAEELMLEAVEGFRMYDLRSLEHWGLRYLTELLRSLGRDEEADAYAERRASLAPASTAAIV
jgi:tetratricopeptide (TPR) repeat protein